MSLITAKGLIPDSCDEYSGCKVSINVFGYCACLSLFVFPLSLSFFLPEPLCCDNYSLALFIARTSAHPQRAQLLDSYIQRQPPAAHHSCRQGNQCTGTPPRQSAATAPLATDPRITTTTCNL